MVTNSLFQSNYLRGKRGFTIAEVLIAIIILTICVLALYSSLHVAFNLINDIRENIIASSIIQQEMESLRKTLFVSLPLSGQSTFSNDSLSSLYNASGTIKVDQYVDANIVRIVIAVIWYSRLETGKQKTKRVVTLIAKNGINSI